MGEELFTWEGFMGVHNREYNGIQFTIHTDENNGRWRWSYTLGDKFFEVRDRPLPSEELAIGEAEHDAQFHIDNGAG